LFLFAKWTDIRHSAAQYSVGLKDFKSLFVNGIVMAPGYKIDDDNGDDIDGNSTYDKQYCTHYKLDMSHASHLLFEVNLRFCKCGGLYSDVVA
jgi:hypothetical protein